MAIASEILYLKEKNQNDRDIRIEFDEKSHRYTVDGVSDQISVTTLVHKHFSDFNEDEVIQSMIKNKEKFEKGEYKEFKDLPPNEIKERIKEIWKNRRDSSTQLGTLMHKYIEYYYNDLSLEDSSDDPYISEKLKQINTEISFFRKFNNEIIKGKYKPYRTEWSIFSQKIKLSGQLDFLCKIKGQKGKYALFDWKRTKDLVMIDKFKNLKKKKQSEFDKEKDKEKAYSVFDLDDINYIHYTVQLNIYKTLLEKLYKTKKDRPFEITEMYLVVLYGENESYIMKSVDSRPELVEYIFKKRFNELNPNVEFTLDDLDD